MPDNKQNIKPEQLLAQNKELNRELNELKEVNLNQQKRVELCQLITENVADLLAIIDSDGKRIWNNKSYYQTLGYTPEELEKTVSFIEIHPDDRAIVQDTFNESIETGLGRKIEYRMKHKNGTWIPLESKAEVVRNEEGDVEALVLVARDISQRKRMEKELIKSQKMQALAGFATKVADDFTGYISEVRSKIEVVSKSVRSDTAEGLLLSDTMHAADKCQELVDELLSLSVTEVRTDQEFCLQDVIKICAKEVVPAGTRIQLDLKMVDYKVLIKGSESMMTEAVKQLFRNAVESMIHGGVLRVTLKTEQRAEDTVVIEAGSYAVLHIKDEGIGIPEDNMIRVFEPYYTTKPGHQGLGLSTAFVTMTEHGGKLSVESAINSGTDVLVHLPAEFQQTIEVPIPDPEEAANPKAKRVLVNDREQFVREFSVAMLKQLGYQADAVEKAEYLAQECRAAQRRRESYNMVLFDPSELDDDETQEMCSKLRSLSPYLKIIATGEDPNDTMILEPETYGFHGSLAKPFKLEGLKALLDYFFGNHKR